jgi:hypothetical protein
LAHRELRLGADEETSTDGVSVSLPSSRGSSSELSDVSGEEGDEVFWLVKPFHKVLRRREPSVVVISVALDSSSLRLLSSTAVCRMLSMPPADSKGYAWRRFMPSMKASLSSHALSGDGGPCSKFSLAQRLGACRLVFPRLEKGQEEYMRAVVSWHTEKVDPLRVLTYWRRCQLGPQVSLMKSVLS